MPNWYHVQQDVKSVYLYGSLKEMVFIKQLVPALVLKGAENKVCLHNKSIYCLIQNGMNGILNWIIFYTM